MLYQLGQTPDFPLLFDSLVDALNGDASVFAEYAQYPAQSVAAQVAVPL